jgi:hypothetical protein
VSCSLQSPFATALSAHTCLMHAWCVLPARGLSRTLRGECMATPPTNCTRHFTNATPHLPVSSYGTGRGADTAGLNLGAVGITPNSRSGKIATDDEDAVANAEGAKGARLAHERPCIGEDALPASTPFCARSQHHDCAPNGCERTNTRPFLVAVVRDERCGVSRRMCMYRVVLRGN